MCFFQTDIYFFSISDQGKLEMWVDIFSEEDEGFTSSKYGTIKHCYRCLQLNVVVIIIFGFIIFRSLDS